MSTCILIFRPIILNTNDIFFYECKVNIRILKEVISFIFYFFSLFCDVSLETFFLWHHRLFDTMFGEKFQERL